MKREDRDVESRQESWARFRFAVVAHLLAAPPRRGELGDALQALADSCWQHPLTGAPVRFGRSTIERWYYTALRAGADPMRALRTAVRHDAGTHPSLSEGLREALRAQHRQYPRWSFKLHYDNLRARARREPSLGEPPSYSVLRRFMSAQGLARARGRRAPDTEGGALAAQRFESREVRSYESEYVAGLYHIDFHECSRALLAPSGEWIKPRLYGCLCDRSRLVCHLQWYWSESAQSFAHGTQQAFMKRGLPRALMTDRGSAELAAESREGLERLGVFHRPTLPYSPYQNAKQEAFWGLVEGRLLAMLEGQKELSLARLNELTQAWVELDYNREVHRELGVTPLERWLEGPSVARACPGPQELRDAFRRTVRRRQRKSDGTFSLEGQRFELPSRYAPLERLVVRYASWDLSNVHLIEARHDTVLCRLWPQDKARNAEGRRPRRQGPASYQAGTPLPPPPATNSLPPLLEEYLEDYAAHNLPPAYLPLSERADKQGREPS